MVAWDLNPGPQKFLDGRCRRIHWAMAVPLVGNKMKNIWIEQNLLLLLGLVFLLERHLGPDGGLEPGVRDSSRWREGGKTRVVGDELKHEQYIEYKKLKGRTYLQHNNAGSNVFNIIKKYTNIKHWLVLFLCPDSTRFTIKYGWPRQKTNRVRHSSDH